MWLLSAMFECHPNLAAGILERVSKEDTLLFMTCFWKRRTFTFSAQDVNYYVLPGSGHSLTTTHEKV